MYYTQGGARKNVRSRPFEQNSNYLDALVQMGVLKIVERGGEEWVAFQRPLSELLDQASSRGLLIQAEDGISPLSAIACAVAVTVLEDREGVFSREDLLGIASVIKGLVSSIFEDSAEGADLRAESVAPVNREHGR